MITDQKQTGVPNAQGLKARTQLVAPHNQASNPGRVAADSSQTRGTLPPAAQSAATSALPSSDQRSQLAQQMLASAQSAAAEKTTGQLATGAGAGSPSPVQSDYNTQAREAIGRMSETELNSLLEDISTGRVSATANKASALGDIFQPREV